MKRLISILSLCLVAVVLVSSLLSCDGVEKKFVGTWESVESDAESESETLVLANDGTGSIESDGMSGSVSWSVDGDKAFFTVSMCGMTETQEYTYEFDGDKMILTDEDGEQTIYRKHSSK